MVKNVIKGGTLPLVLLFMEKESWVTEISSEPTLESVWFPLLFLAASVPFVPFVLRNEDKSSAPLERRTKPNYESENVGKSF